MEIGKLTGSIGGHTITRGHVNAFFRLCQIVGSQKYLMPKCGVTKGTRNFNLYHFFIFGIRSIFYGNRTYYTLYRRSDGPSISLLFFSLLWNNEGINLLGQECAVNIYFYNNGNLSKSACTVGNSYPHVPIVSMFTEYY